jgi:dGTPase
VAQIGRTLARALACNEDLTEAICLAHDLGHPPFGHTGEWTLNDLMHEQGGFNHQKQTYRIVTQLERRYTDHPGLNLTYEVLEGVVKHDTDYDVVDALDYNPDERGTLECQIANLADEIAYNTSDLDDGLRSGTLDPVAVRKLGAAQSVLAGMGEAPDADLSDNLMRYRFIRELVGMEVSDVIAATEQNLAAAGVRTLAGLRSLRHNVAGYTPVMMELNKELKAYLLGNFYRHFRVMRMAAKARRLITDLFTVYTQDEYQLPAEVQQRLKNNRHNLARVVCDYIAGMTDRYAIQEHKRLFDPTERA